MRPSRLGVAEGCWGAGLVVVAGPLLRSVSAEPVSRRVIDIARVLGARQLLQGVLTIRRPTRRTLRGGAAVDALHALTMITATAAHVGPRRLTSASAGVAVMFAATALALAGSRRPR